MKYARAWHGLTFVVAAGAVVLQLVLVVQGHQHLGDSEPAIEAAGTPGLGTRLVRFASYLTIWTNVLGAATAFTLLRDPQRDGRIWRALRLDAVVILFGGGLVHWFLLRPLLDLSGADLVADRLLHIVVPILVVIGWIAFGPRRRIDTGDLGRFLVVPLVWFAYTLIRGAIVDWYPYPFVDVNEHGYPTVVLTALAIGAVLMVLALACRVSDRYLR
ncbi:MAG: Pr6Pr family membrane protein [Kribbellaceae bacterium]|nr:Pr6Pr family membrane protein [Kribbellaceae bacterium]